MTRAKPEIIRETVKCPFCGQGDIEVMTTLDWYSEGRAHAAGKSKMIPQYHPEKKEILNKCPSCDKSKSELKEAIENFGKMSFEERIQRLRSSGLPTVIESKPR